MVTERDAKYNNKRECLLNIHAQRKGSTVIEREILRLR